MMKQSLEWLQSLGHVAKRKQKALRMRQVEKHLNAAMNELFHIAKEEGRVEDWNHRVRQPLRRAQRMHELYQATEKDEQVA